jgi:CRISPR-associated protein Csd2
MGNPTLIPQPEITQEAEEKLVADLGLVGRPNEKYFPSDLRNLYTIYEYRHAATILANEFPSEFDEICHALRQFRFTDEQVRKPGGNESEIPKTISDQLRPRGWIESRLHAKQVVDEKTVSIDTHKIDYLKSKVAFDLEWNAKDQTFDRDLAAFRAFFDYGRISVGVLATRDPSLVPYFISLGKALDRNGLAVEGTVIAKYGHEGGSTTHMNKLLPRVSAGRSGGCPVLAFGITPQLRSPSPWVPPSQSGRRPRRTR